jgi:hypothetical protein
MGKRQFRIKAYKHPYLKFVVRSKLSGKWERKFFRTKAEAQTYVCTERGILSVLARPFSMFNCRNFHAQTKGMLDGNC